ncbi:cytochrome P450 [Mycena galericulata]|nr:cytochrome P450 [Mycena galericulata]
MTSQFLIPIVGTLAAYVLVQLAKALHEELTSPLRNLPGPKGALSMLGHFKTMDVCHPFLPEILSMKAVQSDSTITTRWRDEFGTNFQYRSLFNKRELYTADTKALNHILINDNVYQKGPVTKKVVTEFLGNGLLAVEMEEHRQQASRYIGVHNPAFGLMQIRELTEIFTQKSMELRDIWIREISAGSGASRIDVFAWLRKMALDAIGAAGFNYQFNAMNPEGRPNDLNEALTQLLHSPQSQRQAMFRVAQAAVPILRVFSLPGNKFVREARSKMVNIGKQLLADSKAAVKAKGGENTSTARDLLSVMVKANMSTDIPENQRLSDADVIAQIPTFLVAGHETTSTATAWALHALSLNLSVQQQLRDEILSVPHDNPTMDELNSLPYLESVIRETMRVHAPVAFTVRVAMDNDVLPLSKPYVDKYGKIFTSIPIRKGTVIRIPIADVQCDKEIWGEDAAEFRPERWEHIPESVAAIPGVWANLLTFLAGS